MAHVAREMERQGFKLPLLIGGATTSQAHTAVKIAPHYSEPVVHVLDASRAVPVTTSLLSDESKPAFVAQAPRRVRASSASIHAHAEAEARAARRRRARTARRSTGAPRTSPAPEFTGVRVLDDFPLATLREYIDWTPFFHTWELKGVYPRILEHEKYGEQARQIFAEANALLDTIIAKKLHPGARRLRPLPARTPSATTSSSTPTTSRTHGARAVPLPAPAGREGQGEPHRCLGDFVAPKETGLARSHRRLRGHDRHRAEGAVRRLPRRARRLQRDHGRGARRPAGRGVRRVPAQAGARRVGLRPRRGPDATSSSSTRSTAASGPPPAIPPAPITPRRATLWQLLDVETQHRHAAHRVVRDVAGLERQRPLLRAPRVALLQLGKIDRDQVADYHARKGMTARRGRALARPEPRLRTHHRGPRPRRLITSLSRLRERAGVRASLARGSAPRSGERVRERGRRYFFPFALPAPLPLPFSSRNAATHASGAFQLIAISLADQASMLSTKHFCGAQPASPAACDVRDPAGPSSGRPTRRPPAPTGTWRSPGAPRSGGAGSGAAARRSR